MCWVCNRLSKKEKCMHRRVGYFALWTIRRHGVSLPAFRRRGVSLQSASPIRRYANAALRRHGAPPHAVSPTRRFADVSFRCGAIRPETKHRRSFRRRGTSPLGISPTHISPRRVMEGRKREDYKRRKRYLVIADHGSIIL